MNAAASWRRWSTGTMSAESALQQVGHALGELRQVAHLGHAIAHRGVARRERVALIPPAAWLGVEEPDPAAAVAQRPQGVGTRVLVVAAGVARDHQRGPWRQLRAVRVEEVAKHPAVIAAALGPRPRSPYQQRV